MGIYEIIFGNAKELKKKEEKVEVKEISDISTFKITPGAFNKMHSYQKVYEMLAGRGIEYYAFMTSPSEKKYLVTDIHLPRNKENTGTYTEVSAEQIREAANELHPKGYNLRGWTHCHPHFLLGGFKQSSSGTDKGNNESVLTGIGAYSYTTDVVDKTLKDLIGKIENDKLILISKFAGEKYMLDVSKLSEKSRKELLFNEITIQKDIHYSFAYSMIISGTPKEAYVELITQKVDRERIHPISAKEVPYKMVEDEKDTKFTDEELIIDVLKKIEFDDPHEKVIRRIGDKILENRISAIPEIKKLIDDTKHKGRFFSRYGIIGKDGFSEEKISDEKDELKAISKDNLKAYPPTPKPLEHMPYESPKAPAKTPVLQVPEIVKEDRISWFDKIGKAIDKWFAIPDDYQDKGDKK